MGLFGSDYGETNPIVWHIILVVSLVMSAFFITSFGFNEVRFVDYTKIHANNRIIELENSLESKNETIKELKLIQPIDYTGPIIYFSLLIFLGIVIFSVLRYYALDEKNKTKLTLMDKRKELIDERRSVAEFELRAIELKNKKKKRVSK